MDNLQARDLPVSDAAVAQRASYAPPMVVTLGSVEALTGGNHLNILQDSIISATESCLSVAGIKVCL